MAKTVTIGCKLPNGIVLEIGEQQVEIDGLNKSVIIGATHVTTVVDADFWAAWKAKNATFSALKSGAIFEASNANEAAAIVKDTGKTGLEPMPQKTKDIEKAVA
jgi:hypothetical protein